MPFVLFINFLSLFLAMGILCYFVKKNKQFTISKKAYIKNLTNIMKCR